MKPLASRQINISTDGREISDVLDLVETFGAEQQIDLGVIQSVAVCIDELLSNMIRHGYPEGTVGKIAVTLTHEKSSLCVVLIDNGMPFDPRNFWGSRRSIDTPTIGGYGLVLVQQLVDDLSYSSADGVNVTTFFKNIRDLDVSAQVSQSMTANNRHRKKLFD